MDLVKNSITNDQGVSSAVERSAFDTFKIVLMNFIELDKERKNNEDQVSEQLIKDKDDLNGRLEEDKNKTEKIFADIEACCKEQTEELKKYI